MKTYEQQQAELWAAINEVDESKRVDLLFEIALEAQTYGGQWEEYYSRVMANYMPVCIAMYVGWAVVAALVVFCFL